MKGQLEELGEETDENVENISKMQGQILNMTKGKVNIFDASGNFKSTYEIMKGIADVWDELSSIDQADLLETIAGKNRANDVAALLSNWQNVEEAVKSANKAEGSAARENAKYVDSLQGRLDKLTTAWQSFATTFMNSDFLKGGISALTKFVELIEKLVDTLGTAGTIGLGAGIFGLFKNRTSIFGDLSAFGSIVSEVMSSSGKLSGKFKDVGSAAKMAGGSIVKGLTSSLSGTIGVIGLVITAIGLAVNAYKNYREEISKARQETIQSSDEFLDASNSFEKVYIKYSGRTDLTAEEESELTSAINGTVDALGDKSSALKDVVSGSNDYLASLERIADEELKAANRAAKDKRDNARLELEDAAMGWARWDGSEVNISLNNSEATRIAKEIGGDFFSSSDYMSDGYGSFEISEIRLSNDADVNEIIEYYNLLLDYQEKLSDDDLVDTKEYEQVTSVIEKLSDSIKLYTDGVYEAAKAQYQLSNGIPKTTEEYVKMRESILNSKDLESASIDTKNTIANTLDSEYSQLFDLSSAETQARKFVGIIKGYGDGTKDGTNEIGTVETFLNMRTAVNNNECSVNKYLSQFDELNKISKDWTDEEKELFNTTFGIDTDSIKKQYEEAEKYFIRQIRARQDDESQSDYTHYRNSALLDIENFLGSLSANELAAVVELKAEIDWQDSSIEGVRKQIEDRVKLNEALNYTIAIDIEVESVESLNTAMAESVSATGLSSDSITALKGRYAELAEQGYDLSAMFEETSNGIHLNRKAVSELEQAYASQKLSETDSQLDVLKDRYDELTDEINNCSDASERAGLYRDQQEIAQKINDLGTLASQYEGLASAYNAWLSAEESGQERDMYEQIIEGFENIGDEISRGWYDDGTIKFLELMTGKTDLAGESASELKKIWKNLDKNIENTSYSVKDFFTVDDDGNSTSTGVYNFLRAIQELESHKDVFKDVKGDIKDLVEIKDGKVVGFNFDIVGGDEAIAEALGISEELVQIMLRAADDAGFVVTLDGNWTQFADLKDQAEKANDAIKKLAQTNEKLKEAGFGEYEFNFGADTVEEINTELDKAKELLNSEVFKNKETGKFDLSIEGADEALKIAETLLIAKQQVEEPAYMSIDTTELQDELQEPVKLLQSYEEKAQKIELLSLTPDINKKEIDTLNNELDGIVKQLQELPEEQRIAIGIDGMSDKEIREQLENGTIEVPAELTIEANMDKSLEDLVTLGLLEQGLIDEKTAKIRLGLEVEVDESDVKKTLEQKIAEATSKPIISTTVADMSSIIGKYTAEEQEVVIKYLADTSEYDSFKAEDKEAVVKFIADSIDVEGYKPEDKQAYAKYLVDGGNLDNYTPEQKEAIVKYFTEDSNIENYEGEDKEAIVKFLAETSEADGYTPQDRQAIAKFIKDSLEVDNYQMPTNKYAYAKYLKDTYDIDIWTPDPKEGVANYTPSLGVFPATRSLTPPALTGGVAWYTPKISGTGGFNGTAHISGTAFSNGTIGKAFKQGDWGTKKTETALTGELGQELVVYKNRFWTVGDNGAEFAHIPKGAIIFNHKQTEELFANGRVTSGGGRGKFYVNGTAFAQGTAYSDGYGGGEEAETPSFSIDYDYNASSDSDSKKSQEIFDWIEVAIERIERSIDRLDQKANNIYKNWSTRNSVLASEIGEVRNEIALQQKAYEGYMSAANQVGLSSEWAKKVQSGAIDIDNVTDEKLAEKIKDYEKYYQAALDCQDAILELKEAESALYKQRFDNVATQYEGALSIIEHEKNMLEEYISQSEASAWLVSSKYYDALADNEQKNISKLKEEKNALLSSFNSAMQSGTIDRYSEAW